MTANELRIGNWVTYNPMSVDEETDIIPLQVTCIDKDGGVLLDDGFDNVYNFDEILPIRLTPEILEKCGFCRDSGFWNISYGFKLYDPLVRGGLGELVQNDTKIFAPMWNNHLLGFGIKHLHQLQNIHFALTGEELTVNLYDNDSE